MKTDSSGNVYVGGTYTAPSGSSLGSFIAKVSPDGSSLIYFSTGGTRKAALWRRWTRVDRIASDGSLYVNVFEFIDYGLGGRSSFAATIYKVDPAGQTWQTVQNFNVINDMALDSQGNLYVTGSDAPRLGVVEGEFPPVVSTPGSLSGTDGSLSSIVKLSADGKVVYAIHN